MTRTGERLHTKYDLKLKPEVVNYTFDISQMLEEWEQEVHEELGDVS